MSGEGFVKCILVPTDGSAVSTMALETAAAIAKRTGASVTVFHVMQELLVSEVLPSRVEEELRGSVRQRAEKIVDGARTLFAEEKVKAEVETKIGRDVAESILERSKEDCDLIVMGARGEDGKAPYALGSVARKVLMHSARPVLVAKKLSHLSSLLVCVDGSEGSKRALDYAVRLAEAMSSSVTLLNVQEHRLHRVSPEAAKELGERVLAKSLDAVKERKLRIDKRLEVGDASDTIVKVAEEGKHDLIVLGSRGLGAVKRFLLGSVSQDVAQEAKRSVLVVP